MRLSIRRSLCIVLLLVVTLIFAILQFYHDDKGHLNVLALSPEISAKDCVHCVTSPVQQHQSIQRIYRTEREHQNVNIHIERDTNQQPVTHAPSNSQLEWFDSLDDKPSTLRPDQLRLKVDVPANVARLHCNASSPTDSLLFGADSSTVVRNCITGDVIGRIPVPLSTVPLKPSRVWPAHELDNERRKSFEKVFETRAWGHDWDIQYRGLNASGMGATLQWTQELTAALHVIINSVKHHFSLTRVTLLDLPCGDMAWMSRFLKTRDDIDYTGVDIVPAIIEHHRRAYSGTPWRFQLADHVEEPLEEEYDVILCRTLLQHLYYSDVMRLLRHFSTSGSRLLLTTSFYRATRNDELVISIDNPGRVRTLNLELPPLALTPPLCVSRDGPPDVREGWDHFVGLWSLPLRQLRKCRDVKTFGFGSKTDVRVSSCTDWSLK